MSPLSGHHLRLERYLCLQRQTQWVMVWGEFEGCKGVFDGTALAILDVVGERILISASVIPMVSIALG